MSPASPQSAFCLALKLCALAVLAWWGLEAGAGAIGKGVLGLGTPLAAAALWSAFVAPRADVEASAACRLLTQVAVFGGAALALAALAAPGLAAAFAVAAALGIALPPRPRAARSS